MSKHLCIIAVMKKILLLLLPVLLASCSLKNRVERSNKKYFGRAPYDVVIVPGYPYYDTTPRFPLLACRMYWVKELYDKGIAKNIIFSGGAIHTQYNEAKVMKIISDTLGIPQRHIFLEEYAPHSYQNVTYGNKLAKKLGFKKIAVATDPYQFSYLTIFLPSAPGVGILTFSPDSAEAKKYFQPLPYFNPRDAYVKDFTPID